MSTKLKDVLRYFIRYEEYSRFMDTSLQSVDGDHLPEEALAGVNNIQETLDKKQEEAILRKLGSYPDIKKHIKANKQIRAQWTDTIRRFLSKEKEVEDFIGVFPFQYPDNRDNFKAYVNQLASQEEFTICYPLMIKDTSTRKKSGIVRPVITFTCKLAEDRLRVTSFVMNRNSLEIIMAEAASCPVEEVRILEAQAYKDLCTKIDSIESSKLEHIIALVDQCFSEVLSNWSYKSILEFEGYSGWLMSRRLFVTNEYLKEMQESIFHSELGRLLERGMQETSPLLHKYIFGNKDSVHYPETLSDTGSHLGSYTAEYPVNDKQWRIMRSLQSAELLAVNGPPGTGKTTLIKEMIADAIVRKALLLIEVWDEPWKLIDEGRIRSHYESPLSGNNPFSMVITSTLNNAVDNIGIELTSEVQFLNSLSSLTESDESDILLDESDIDPEDNGVKPSPIQTISESKSSGFFCARLGNRDNMNEFRSQKFEEIVKRLTHPDIGSLQDPHVRTRFMSSIAVLQRIYQEIDKFWGLLQLCLERGELNDERDVLASIEKRKKKVEIVDEKIANETHKLGDFLQSKLKREEEILKLEKLVLHLESELIKLEEDRRQSYADMEILSKWKSSPLSLLNFLPKRKSFLKANPSESFIQETRIEPINQAIKDIMESIKDSNLEISNYRTDLVALYEQLEVISKELKLLEDSKATLHIGLSSLEDLLEQESILKKELQIEEILTSQSYYKLANAPVVLQLRKQLFEEALTVNEQYVMKYHVEIAHNLEKMGEKQRWFNSFYSENGIRLDQYEKGIRAIWESFFLCFPIATTTLHSFSEQLFQPLQGLIDTLFVDEAGQIMPHYLCAPLFRSQRAVIVGDPEQLEPVRPFTLNLIEESNVSEELHEHINLLHNSAQDYADRGSEFFEFMGKKKKGIILVEHRRCESNIMRFSNSYVYNEMLLLIKKDDANKPFGANLVAFDIRGLKEPYVHCNYSEISACQKIVRLLVEKYGPEILSDIGIITPFQAQAKQLRTVISGVEVGTVHTFQGREKRIILFSSVLDGIHPKNLGLTYVVGSKPNMLNVAFSRAKEQFIFVGNIETGLASGNYLARAIQTIQQYGVIYSLYNEAFENEKYVSKRSEAYAVYQDDQELEGIDSRLIEDMNNLLHANILLSPKQHYLLMIKAFEYCRNSLGIVSPWISSNVMNDMFFSLLTSAMERKVDIRVRFGYSSSKLTLNDIDKIVERDNFNYGNKEEIKEALKKLHGHLGQNLVYMPPLHTKVLLIDNKLLFIGSHNWLSNHGKLAREEISYLITDKQTIAYVKKRFEL